MSFVYVKTIRKAQIKLVEFQNQKIMSFYFDGQFMDFNNTYYEIKSGQMIFMHFKENFVHQSKLKESSSREFT
jgi:hypothetical protein